MNPAASLLTWASLNFLGGGEILKKRIYQFLKNAYDKADSQIIEWEIEHNKNGWRADAFLYCIEAKSPATGYWVPLVPSWVVSEKTKIVAVLELDRENQRYIINIIENASEEQYKKAKEGTIKNGRLVCPESKNDFAISEIKGGRRINGDFVSNLRLWESYDLAPRPDDIFQERLYCIRWVETYIDNRGQDKSRHHYCSVTDEDLDREEKVLWLLQQKFEEWQERGFIPSKRIASGYNTDQPIRERGWTYWHHLFNPRQLLCNGLLQSVSEPLDKVTNIAAALAISKIIDWNAKLCAWMPHATNLKGNQVFTNQALNTLYSYSCRPLTKLKDTWLSASNFTPYSIPGNSIVQSDDARNITYESDLWITDPPYADSVNYHELGDYFNVWYFNRLNNSFPKWHADCRKVLAVKGKDDSLALPHLWGKWSESGISPLCLNSTFG